MEAQAPGMQAPSNETFGFSTVSFGFSGFAARRHAELQNLVITGDDKAVLFMVTVKMINQLDMHEHVFQPLLASGMEPAALTPIVTEYVRSVYRFYLPLHPLVNELLINLLLDQQLYYEFHQHLQYDITQEVDIVQQVNSFQRAEKMKRAMVSPASLGVLATVGAAIGYVFFSSRR